MPGTAPSYDWVMDPKGDLVLIVGPEQKRFQVCSRTMARTSDYWKTLLYGPFKEGRSNNQPADGKEWEVKLGEDTPQTLKIILDIIHGNIDAVPATLNHDELVALTKATNYFGMTHALRPHWRAWYAKLPDASIDFERLVCVLQIARELGDFNSFVAATETLAINSYEDAKLDILCYSPHDAASHSNGVKDPTKPSTLNPVPAASQGALQVLDDNKILVDLGILGKLCTVFSYSDFSPLTVPPFFAGVIQGIRDEHLKGISQVVVSAMEKLVSPGGTTCAAKTREISCACTMLGALHKTLHFRGLKVNDLLMTDTHAGKTAKQWLEEVRAIREEAIVLSGLPDVRQHALCEPFKRPGMFVTMISAGLTESLQRKDFDMKAKASGIKV